MAYIKLGKTKQVAQVYNSLGWPSRQKQVECVY